MKYITFAVPCYNSENYMRRCIDSLLAGGRDVEIILINDGSTDRTAQIADEYQLAHPDIVRAVHKENGGHGSGVNKGLELARGVYYKVVDSDDWLDQEAYRKLLARVKDLAAVDPESESGQCDWESILKQVLPYVDFFVPSIEELAYMVDREKYQEWQERAEGEDIVSILSLSKDVRPLAEKVLSYGCGAVLLKCGAAGMYLKTSGKERMRNVDADLEGWENTELFEDSFVPERILSGTGAGDTSIAAFLYAAMQGCTPKESVEYAAATGACCVSTYDTISGLKSFAELREKIQNGWKKQKIMKE